MPINIGVLALQGDYAAHGKKLGQLDIKTTLITEAKQLQAVDGLIIPGGESTTLLKLMAGSSFFDQLKKFHQQQKPLFGTCAGMILLAKHVDPDQDSLGLIDISVKRNGYGRQLQSFIVEQITSLDSQPIEMVFIRAPQVVDQGPAVKVLACHNQQAVLVQQQQILAASFHPELSQSYRIHQHFIDMVTGSTSNEYRND